MRKHTTVGILFYFTLCFIGLIPQSHADIWGGDVAVLVQILSNAIQQLQNLRRIVDLSNGQSDLLKQVNRDIGKALTEVYAMQDLVRDTTSLGKIKDPTELLFRLQGIYGRIPKLGNIPGYEFSDQVAGNGLGADNDIHEHARLIDRAALALQREVKTASPGRAQQLTAQSQAAILHSLAQIERANGTLVRIASTDLALKNQDAKSKAQSFNEGYEAMANSHADEKTDLKLVGVN